MEGGYCADLRIKDKPAEKSVQHAECCHPAGGYEAGYLTNRDGGWGGSISASTMETLAEIGLPATSATQGGEKVA